MVGRLIRLSITIRRHSPSVRRRWGIGLGLVAVAGTWGGTLAARPVARADVLTLLLALWFAGWLVGPVLASGAAVLRPEYFTLLPLPRRRLAVGLLASVFAGVGAVLTALAVLALVGYAIVAATVVGVLVGLVAAVLFLVLVVAVSRTIYALLGAAMRTQLGVELAAVQYGLLIATLFVGWLAVSPALGATPVLLADGLPGDTAAAVLGWTPAGWPVRAVDAAAAGNLAAAAGWLALLAAATVAAVAAAVALLTPYVGNRTMRQRRRRLGSRVLTRRGLLPASAFGGVLGKELRTWWRDPWRSLEIRSSIWFGLFITGYGYLAGHPQVGVLAGVAVAVMVGLSGANLYGQDGTALWQLVVAQHPVAIQADVRGRQVALLVVFGVPACLLSGLMTVLTGEFGLALPVFAGLAALLGAGSAVAVLMSVLGVTPGVDPHRRVNPTDAGENPIVPQVALWLTSVLVAPTIVAAIFLAIDPAWLPGWFAGATLAVAVLNAVLTGWGIGALAVRRLAAQLPQTFARLRYPTMPSGVPSGGSLLDQLAGAAEKEAIAAATKAGAGTRE